MSDTTDWTEKVARVWAEMDGKAELFEKDKANYKTSANGGLFFGWLDDVYGEYMDETTEILIRSGIASALRDAKSETQALIAAAYEAAVGEVLMPLLSSTLASKEQAYTESFSDAMGERADAIELSIRRIRALTPADARAALDRRDRQMRAEGMREAAEVCTRLALDDASFIIRSRAENVDAQ